MSHRTGKEPSHRAGGRPLGGSHEWLTWSVTTRDRWRVLTWLAAAGLAVAGGMAVAGLPPFDVHGLLHHFGVMDPLCGGTRSVRLAAMGHWSEAWRYNPVGVPLVLGAGVLLVRAATGWATGRWITVAVGWTRWRRWSAWGLLGVLFVLLTINQQAHAALLLATE